MKPILMLYFGWNVIGNGMFVTMHDMLFGYCWNNMNRHHFHRIKLYYPHSITLWHYKMSMKLSLNTLVLVPFHCYCRNTMLLYLCLLHCKIPINRNILIYLVFCCVCCVLRVVCMLCVCLCACVCVNLHPFFFFFCIRFFFAWCVRGCCVRLIEIFAFVVILFFLSCLFAMCVIKLRQFACACNTFMDGLFDNGRKKKISQFSF